MAACEFEFLFSLSEASDESRRISSQEDDIYGIIMSYKTCLPEDSVFEGHAEYIDIQMSLENSETIDWFPPKKIDCKRTR